MRDLESDLSPYQRMPPRLILNADDFGLTRGINRAIAELHTLGALTSATLMASGPAFDDAVTVARAHPNLGVGCHIILTDGQPISPPHTIPTLIGPDNRTFRPTLSHFLRDLHLHRIDPADILCEAHAQIQHLQHHGIDVTHIDTHKHTHIFPRVARPILAAAERTGVRAIRNPFEPSWSADLSHASPLRRLQLRILYRLRSRFLGLPQIKSHSIRTTDGTLGIAATGHLDATTLDAILSVIPPNSNNLWEIVCHPGYNDADLDGIRTRLRSTREVELSALISTFAPSSKQSPQPRALKLIHYRDASRPHHS